MKRRLSRKSGLRPGAPVRWLLIRYAPFEAAIAAIIIVQSVIALNQWGVIDPVAALLPVWLRYTFNISYGVAGLLILGGMAWPRGDVEGAGLVLLSSTLVARGIMFGYLLGWEVQAITSLAFSLFLTGAAAGRITTLTGAPSRPRKVQPGDS